MRKREEIQEMPRRNLLIFFVFSTLAHAAIWPDQFGHYKLDSTKTPAISDKELWDEYGLDLAEQGLYSDGAKKLTATAWRMKDPTGAWAVFQWIRPSEAKPSKIADNAVTTPKGVIINLGNYVLQFEGPVPARAELLQIGAALPRLDQSSLPPLRDYIPAKSLVPNSERYVLGPVSLDRFAHSISPSIAAFHLGAEAEVAKFTGKGGESTLAIFSYPTPQIARQLLDTFQKVPGAMARRAGPMISIIVSPTDADYAERLLAQVKYEPTVTWSEPVNKTQNAARDTAKLILGICVLAGILIVASVLLGFFFGGSRILLERFGIRRADHSFTALNIGEK
jgi:hypothetical protein